MRAFLSSLPLFQALPESELETLAAAIERVSLEPGQHLFRQGDPGDALFIIESGALEVIVVSDAGEAHTLDTVGPGQVVGEMAVLYGRPRSATAQAAAATRLLKLTAASLDELERGQPSARTRLLDAAAGRLPSLYLASVPMFAGLDAQALRELDLERHWVRLAGGDVLFEEGDEADYMYVVARGRLAVSTRERPGHVRHLGHGDVVGEVAIFTGDRRNATVRAVRDSELVRLSRADVHQLIERHPRGAIEMVHRLVRRVRPGDVTPPEAPVSTVAVLPTGRACPTPECLATLVAALAEVGGSALHVDEAYLRATFGVPVPSLDDEVAGIRAKAWLHDQEARGGFVVFDLASLPASWSSFCLRQSDLILLVAGPDADVTDDEGPRRLAAAGGDRVTAPRLLVRLHAPDTRCPAGTAAWLGRHPVARHHHVRLDRPGDYQRVARFVAGRANGVALSGGGARTLAHIGVLQALQDRGVPVDMIGGVSAGAFSAAYTALGHDAYALEKLCLDNMNNYRLASDATVPMTSFLSARNYVRIMQQMFGETAIEDMWLPFFCLSANLTTARTMVHDRGPLWRALRASTSVPGIHPPVCVNGELLVDGGVLNNIPIDIMRERCPGQVIASDVSLTVDLRTTAPDQDATSGWRLLGSRLKPVRRSPAALPHIFEILTRTATLSSTRHAATVAQSADLYVRTPTAGVSTLDWDAGVVLFERARTLAYQAIDDWNGGRHDVPRHAPSERRSDVVTRPGARTPPNGPAR